MIITITEIIEWIQLLTATKYGVWFIVVSQWHLDGWNVYSQALRFDANCECIYCELYDGIKKKDLSPPVIIWIMEIIAACEEKWKF